MLKVSNYLPNTAKKDDHPRANAMRDFITKIAKEKNVSLVNLTISGDGVAVLDIDGKDAEAYIREQLGQLQSVVITDVSPFELQLETNRRAQEKADKSSKTRAAKKEKTGDNATA